MAGAGLRAVRLHQLEDVVPPDDDLAVVGDDQLELLAVLLVLFRVEADLLGVLHEVEARRRLRDPGEDRVLRERQLADRLAEVAVRRGLHAVGVVAVEAVVQVGGDDRLFAVLTGIGLGELGGLDDLAQLALVRLALECPLGEQAVAHELLGDRRGAARPAGDGVEAGREDADRVEARVRPELLVLDRGRRIEHLVGDVAERDDLAAERAEPGELDLAGAVVDDRGLLEVELVEDLLGIGQARGVLVVHAHGKHHAHEPGEERQGDDDDGDRNEDPADRFRSTRSLGAPVDRSAMPLAPREACLHLRPGR